MRYIQVTKLLVKVVVAAQAKATPVKFLEQDGDIDFNNIERVMKILNIKGGEKNPHAVKTLTKRETIAPHGIQVTTMIIDFLNLPTMISTSLGFTITINPYLSMNYNGKNLAQGEPSTNNMIMWNKDASNSISQIQPMDLGTISMLI